MTAKTYLILLKGGIYLSLITVFLVFNNLLFPFITSKQLFFNILIEILTVVWLSFIIKFPLYRPKKSWISFGLIGFFTVILISSLFGVDLNLSIWGDIERMLGFFDVLHFLLYYLIIITVFRRPQDWRNLFILSVAVALIESYYCLFLKYYGTIGNTAYVSGYIIFNIYFVLILFFNRRGLELNLKKNWPIGLITAVVVLIMLSVMKVTHTRGAYVGLALSFLALFLSLIFLSGSKKVKIYSLAVLAVMILSVSSIFIFAKSDMVQNNSILSTITQISVNNVTFQTRLISWQTAWKDFPHHPWLGTGYGNFAITFDKYFDPKFYNFTTAETYFDRAHNNLVEIASTTGSLGLLAYLSIFVAVLYYLVRGLKLKEINIANFTLIIALLVGYFVQNLAVFDSLVTYMALMITLGYIYWLVNKNEESELSVEAVNQVDNKEVVSWLIVGLVMLAIIFQYNIKPWLMLEETIKGQLAFSQSDAQAGIDAYKKAEDYNTVLNRDSRSSLINLISANPNLVAQLAKDKLKEFLDFAIKLAQTNVSYNPQDSMMQLQLANILNTASMFYTDNTNQFYFYSDRALEAINKSIDASPGRVTIYFSKAQIYLTRGDKDNAIETLKYAVSLNPKYSEPVCLLAKVDIYFGQDQPGYEAMDQCLDAGGSAYLAPADFVRTVINHYSDKKDGPRSIILYERLTALESDAKNWVILAKLYADAGQKDKAIQAAQKAGELDKSLESAAENFINSLK